MDTVGPRRFIVSVVALGVAVAIPLGPGIAWHSLPSTAHTVVIVDKTVPRADYREHAGLVWLLNHRRVEQGRGNRDPGAAFDESRDYFGWQPARLGEARRRELSIEPDTADLVYLADTYGVYEHAGAEASPLRSVKAAGATKLLTGGVQPRELAEIKAGLRVGGLLVAEFNTFASPTSPAARTQLARLLAVRWRGWIGRHYADLGPEGDLPGWVRQDWERVNRRAWPFAAGGYLLARHDGRLLVLEEGPDISMRGLQLRFSRDRQRAWGVPASLAYDGWFDVVQAAPGARVSATFALDVTKAGAAKLAGVRLPARFPAVVQRDGERMSTLYLAADGADQVGLPDAYARRWLPWWRARTAPRGRNDQRAFYWRVYVPLVSALLDDLPS